jgi:hypothetical protein
MSTRSDHERRLARRVATLLVATFVALRAARLIPTFGMGLSNESRGASDHLSDLFFSLLAIVGASGLLVVVGWAIVTRQPRNSIGRYAQDVESAIYFRTLEALNNVAKYAEATRAIVRVSQQDGHVAFAVEDDGRGFDATATSYGTGLQGMADRLDAVGGELHVESSPGTGATVTGRIPVTR